MMMFWNANRSSGKSSQTHLRNLKQKIIMLAGNQMLITEPTLQETWQWHLSSLSYHFFIELDEGYFASTGTMLELTIKLSENLAKIPIKLVWPIRLPFSKPHLWEAEESFEDCCGEIQRIFWLLKEVFSVKVKKFSSNMQRKSYWYVLFSLILMNTNVRSFRISKLELFQNGPKVLVTSIKARFINFWLIFLYIFIMSCRRSNYQSTKEWTYDDCGKSTLCHGW